MDAPGPSTDALPLRGENLGALAARLAVPTYDRGALRPAIVHLGVGNFHRAHQGLYLDELAERRITTEWGERGIGLLPADRAMAEALAAQDHLYTVVARDATGDVARVVGSLTDYAFAPGEPARALGFLTDPATRIVSLTITEGGYLIDDETGRFDADDPAVRADLRDPAHPRTVFGHLCAALAARRAAGTAPFTVLSCDNLQGNGEVARRAVTAFARLLDEDLARWIDERVAFPSAMVDRITPRTTDADRALVAATFGVADRWPVLAEPFRQWVIEDHFCDGRPPLEEVGAQIVPDVRPYETMKLRLLNGSHQALAYLGTLAGFGYAHEASTDPTIRRFVERLMAEEVAPLLPAVPGVDLAAYRRTLLERFANPAIRDTLARLATDGSDRMPKFVVPSLEEALAAGRPHRRLTLVVAGFIRYLRGFDERGATIALNDRRAAELRDLAANAAADPRPILRLRPVFGDLAARDAWVGELAAALRQLDAAGAHATVAGIDGRG